MVYKALLISTLHLLTLDCVLCLTQSDGYNIGVILGSIIAGLVAIGIAGFILYMCCFKNWISPEEIRTAPYKRQTDFTTKTSKHIPRSKGGYIGRGGLVTPKELVQQPPQTPPTYYPTSGVGYRTQPDDRTALVSIVGSRQVMASSIRYTDPIQTTSAVRASPAADDSIESLYKQSSQTAYDVARAQATATAAKSSPPRISAAYIGTGV